MSGLHFGIVAAVLAVLSFTQCRGMSWSCDAMTGDTCEMSCTYPHLTPMSLNLLKKNTLITLIEMVKHSKRLNLSLLEGFCF